MNTFKKQPIFIIILLLTLCGLFTTKVHAVPMTMNYQGNLTNTQGIPLDNISVKVIFKLYDAKTGGNLLWTEEHTSISVTKGFFNAVLGESNSLYEVLANDNLYLSMSVENDPEMTPRYKLHSAAFSVRAAIADTVAEGAITSNKIAKGAVTADKNGVINIAEAEPGYTATPTNGFGKFYVRPAGVNFDSKSSLVNDLVLYWKMDDLTGETVADSVLSNDGTAFNNPSIVDGKFGKARSFNGSQKQYLNLSNNEAVNFSTNPFAIAFWMKADTPEDWTIIMSKANGDHYDDSGWIFGNADSKN